MPTYDRPSIASANRLLLVSALLVVTLGSLMQLQHAGWGLIGTELLLILGPTLLALRLARRPVLQTLRVRRLPTRLALLSVIIGAAGYPVAVRVDVLMAALFGYIPDAGVALLPNTIGQALVIWVALAVAAPLCEEALFRGYVQRAYGRLGFRGVVVASMLFALFHFRLQGLAGVLLLGLVHGYVFFRSGSLWSSIIVHALNNALAGAVVVLAGLGLASDAGISAVLLAPATTVAALLWLVVGLVNFARLSPGPSEELTEPEAAPAPVPADAARPSAGRLATYWPLAVFAVLYLVLGGAELVVYRFPELLPAGALVLDADRLPDEATYTYALTNIVGNQVGEAACHLARGDADYALECDITQSAFDVQVGASRYLGGVRDLHLEARWDATTVELLSLAIEDVIDGNPFWHTVSRGNGALQLDAQVGDGREVLELPPAALIEYEAPFRLMAVDWAAAGGAPRPMGATIAQPLTWRPETESSGPVARDARVVRVGSGQEETPAGAYEAWHVRLTDRMQAWYRVDAPHLLARYHDGVLTWELLEVSAP